MNAPSKPDADLEKRLSDRLMEVFIRAGLILVMVILCYEIFSPFFSLMVWALILAVTMYPAHQKLANKMGGKQGHAATVMVLAGILLIVVPTTVLVNPIGDSVHNFINGVRDNTLQIPHLLRLWRSGRCRQEGVRCLVTSPCLSAVRCAEHATEDP